MSEFNIEVQGGSSVRLPTAGKYCDRDIIVTASGGGTEEIENIIDESGVLDSTDGTATDKVEQLIDYAECRQIIQEHILNNDVLGSPFRKTGIKDVSIFDFSEVKLFSQMFGYCYAIEHIDVDMSSATFAERMCVNCTNLKTVKISNSGKVTSFADSFTNCSNLTQLETLDCSSITAFRNLVLGCDKLVTLKFVAETIKASIILQSPVLSAESIQSIIDGLAKVETAQTLTLNVNTKILQSQVDSANAKGWTVAGGTVVSEEEYYG